MNQRQREDESQISEQEERERSGLERLRISCSAGRGRTARPGVRNLTTSVLKDKPAAVIRSIWKKLKVFIKAHGSVGKPGTRKEGSSQTLKEPTGLENGQNNKKTPSTWRKSGWGGLPRGFGCLVEPKRKKDKHALTTESGARLSAAKTRKTERAALGVPEVFQ